MPNSTSRPAIEKPAKPTEDFPLFPHATRRWAKKIRGKLHYFGPWDDPDGALAKYLSQREDLHAGRTPREESETGLTVKELVNQYLNAKRREVEDKERSPRTLRDAHTTCKRIVEVFGRERFVEDLTPDDFRALKAKMAKTLSKTSMATEIARSRAVFNFATNEDEPLVEKPVRFGRDFRVPSKKARERERQDSGNAKRMFERDEILAMIDKANVPFKAMILLGVNCGFGNTDCATLTIDAMDLDAGWVEHPRQKTGVERRCPLWPETVEALRESLANRRKPRERADANLVFLTQQGKRWVRLVKKRGSDSWEGAVWTDAVSVMARDLLGRLALNKRGRGFYSLRHVFETIGGESIDQVAVNHIMGHTDRSMAGQYRERISDERLRAVSDHVRTWLFGGEKSERAGR